MGNWWVTGSDESGDNGQSSIADTTKFFDQTKTQALCDFHCSSIWIVYFDKKLNKWVTAQWQVGF